MYQTFKVEKNNSTEKKRENESLSQYLLGDSINLRPKTKKHKKKKKRK